MTYHQNETDYLQRLERRKVELENMLTTERMDRARLEDQIAKLQTERDEARTVAREMADDDIDDESMYCQFGCGAKAKLDYGAMQYKTRHAPDCPVSKVRAWDEKPRGDTPKGDEARSTRDRLDRRLHNILVEILCATPLLDRGAVELGQLVKRIERIAAGWEDEAKETK